MPAKALVGSRPSILDPFTDCRHELWNDGRTSATLLVAVIQVLGYRNGYATRARLLSSIQDTRHRAIPCALAAEGLSIGGLALRHPTTSTRRKP